MTSSSFASDESNSRRAASEVASPVLASAIPTVAAIGAGASFIPLPTNRFGWAVSRRTIASFCSGEVPAKTS